MIRSHHLSAVGFFLAVTHTAYLSADRMDSTVEIHRLPNVGQATLIDHNFEAKSLPPMSNQEPGMVKTVWWQSSESDNDLDFEGAWQSGFWFSTKNGQFKASIGGRVEQDSIWFNADQDLQQAVGSSEDGVFFRRARIHGAGTMYEVIDFFAEFEAAPVDSIVFQDMWGQIRVLPYVGHLRVGHIKVPFGLENNTSAKYVTFMERSAVHDAFQQEYDPGVMIWNYNADEDVTWALAVLRLDREESGRAFGNGQYSVAARMTSLLLDLKDEKALVHLGGNFRYDNDGFFDPTTGEQGVQYQARPELRNTSRFVDTGFIGASGASYVDLESAIVLGRFSAQAEYVRTTVHDASIPAVGNDLGNVVFDGYYVYASYILTGESRSYDRKTGRFGEVKPIQNYHPGHDRGPQGAWEMGVRYSNVDLDADGISGGKLETTTAALTWYLNPNTKVMLNYIYALRHPPGSLVDQDANMLGMRFHLAF